MGRNSNGTFKVTNYCIEDALEYRNGKLYWKVQPKVNIQIGCEAGTLYKNGYIGISLNNKRYYAHRIVWYLHHKEWVDCIDHINQCKTDNRIENLRVSDKQKNGLNRGANKNNSSGFKGVTWDKTRSKWKASIKINYKTKFLGRFDTALEASKAYEIAFNQLTKSLNM